MPTGPTEWTMLVSAEPLPNNIVVGPPYFEQDLCLSQSGEDLPVAKVQLGRS